MFHLFHWPSHGLLRAARGVPNVFQKAFHRPENGSKMAILCAPNGFFRPKNGLFLQSVTLFRNCKHIAIG